MNIIYRNSPYLSTLESEQLLTLWNSEFPTNISFQNTNELLTYLSKLEDIHHIFLMDSRTILGWFFDFIREEERNFGLLLNQSIQGQGWGKMLIKHSQNENEKLTAWVVSNTKNITHRDGRVYHSPRAFYKKLGFEEYPKETMQDRGLTLLRIRWTK